MTWKAFGVSLCLVLSLGLLSAQTAEANERRAISHFALGVGSVLCTLVYGTVKTGYALGGSLTGGLAWIFTGLDREIANRIIQPAVRGDYVVVPENLTSERPLIFVGRNPDYSY